MPAVRKRSFDIIFSVAGIVELRVVFAVAAGVVKWPDSVDVIVVLAVVSVVKDKGVLGVSEV